MPQGDPKYDAARANMGYPYMMPTKTQCEELINNTTYKWTTVNGVNGGKFINKIDSSKYIFLSPGGYWSTIDDTGEPWRSQNGYTGWYWSTTLYSFEYREVWSMSFYSTRANMYDNSRRYNGLPIRAVRQL